ncbi:MAG: hypothetical protein RIR37_710, partial [Verrucomicrobiota bacterium]
MLRNPNNPRCDKTHLPSSRVEMTLVK